MIQTFHIIVYNRGKSLKGVLLDNVKNYNFFVFYTGIMLIKVFGMCEKRIPNFKISTNDETLGDYI